MKFTRGLEDLDLIDALLERYKRMAEAARPCRVIPFPKRPRPAAPAQATGPATVYIYKEEKEARLAWAEECAAQYIPTEIRIEMLLAAEQKKQERREYQSKCEQIEKYLDELAAPPGGSAVSRGAHMDFLRGTTKETDAFVEDYAKRRYEKMLSDYEKDGGIV